MDELRGHNFSSDEVKAAVHQWFQKGKKERLFKRYIYFFVSLKYLPFFLPFLFSWRKNFWAHLCKTSWNYFFLNNQPVTLINQIYSVLKLYMFRATSLPITRNFLPYIRHWWVSCRILMTISKQSQDGTAVPSWLVETCGVLKQSKFG